MPEFLWPDIPDKVCRGIRMSVCMAVKTDDPAAWTLGPPVLGLIELLLGKWSDQ